MIYYCPSCGAVWATHGTPCKCRETQEVLFSRSSHRTVRDMANACYEIAVRKGWWENDRNDGECIALMHSELSEALEALRKPDQRDEHCPDFCNLAIELADCVIRIFDYCGARGIDIEGAIIDKMHANADRPHRHGGKQF